MERLCFVLAFLPGFLFLFQPSYSALLNKVIALLLFLIGFISFFRRKEKSVWYSFPIWIWIFPLSFFILGFAFHSFHLTKTFLLNFSIWDLDYIGLRILLRNIAKGESFASPYYEDGNSYLYHHFAPGIAFLAPFEFLPFGQFNYAVGIITVYLFGAMCWSFLFIKERKFVGLLILLNSLYMYRLGVSFHFEVLVLPFSLFFYYFWFFKRESGNVLKMLSLLCFLSIKEDIALYLVGLGVLIFLFEKDRIREARILILSCLLYTFFTQAALHFLSGNSSLEFWISEWNKSYTESISNPLDWEKRKNVVLNVSLGFGFFLFRKNVFVFLVYALLGLHLISDRPWYNEVYSYYSYTILPFALIALFENEKRTNENLFLVVFLGFALYRNSWDQEFPMNVAKDSNPTIPTWIETNNSPVFCQQNLSIFASSNMNIFPLTKMSCKLGETRYALISEDAPPYPVMNKEELKKISEEIVMRGGKIVQSQIFLEKKMDLYKLNCP